MQTSRAVHVPVRCFPISRDKLTLTNPYTRATSTAMPKRKWDVQEQPPQQPPSLAPTPPLWSEEPRRSSRRAKTPNMSYTANSIRSSEAKRGEALWDTKEGVEEAMEKLTEMEHKLQSEVRKQRIAVETSDLPATTQNYDEKSQIAQRITETVKNSRAKKTKGGLEKTQDPALNEYKTQFFEAEDSEANMLDVNPDRGARRAPPINSDYLPLPWKGRLGYACLNTYMRNANPPVFSSRTCRIDSIINHRYPLTDPLQPEHPTKNPLDKSKDPDPARGKRYVEALGIANAKDIAKMIRWNDKYGIRFMRLSSEMFPFASHVEHGYRLAPFASGVLAEAGKVIAELGHRVTTHPGQFTQIGSPRKEVVTAAIRDLEYHDEMLSLLKLPEQMDRDAVMILHLGGTFGDKAATLDRFRENYACLSDGIKKRLVLENDDVGWTVHDLLPLCEELNIPMVLDFHHHNILFDSTAIREGTLDIMSLFDRIKQTWTRKGIRQKMHYSEQTASATTPHDRRKHSHRVRTLPPCAPDMDLMIEAKDKEQAVFELMRTFKLPGWHLFNDVVPYERDDESRKEVRKKVKKGKRKKQEDGPEEDEIETLARDVAEEDVSMGGPESRVYWPEGMEEWLRPRKRVMKKATKEEDE